MSSFRVLRFAGQLGAWLIAILATRSAPAGEPVRPTGTGGLREMTTDRPDATESPATVDAGHLQLEMDGASFMTNRRDGLRTTEWIIAPFNLRFGLTPKLEAGIFVVPYVRRTEQPRGGRKVAFRGRGDTTLRMKCNFWGNDGGASAGGLIADLKLPTAADGIGNDKVEGAVTLPVSFELGGGWETGAMTSAEMAQTDSGRRLVWVNTMTFAHDLAPGVGTFFELTSAAGDGTHVATFNCGLSRTLSANLKLDCGLNIGLSRNAPDLLVFAGISRRF